MGIGRRNPLSKNSIFVTLKVNVNKFDNHIWNWALKRGVLRYGFQFYTGIGGYPVLDRAQIL